MQEWKRSMQAVRCAVTAAIRQLEEELLVVSRGVKMPSLYFSSELAGCRWGLSLWKSRCPENKQESRNV